MPLTPEREQFIADMANDEWVDRLPPSINSSCPEFEALSDEIDREMAQFLEHTRDPEELHCFADLWNWDGGVEQLHAVIRNPACDLSTARLVFWRAQPLYFIRRPKSQDPDDEGWGLILEIMERVREGVYLPATLEYDPREMSGVIGELEAERYGIPVELCDCFPADTA